ncbi:unnamed protein product, partial [marine sediment metagenome]
MSEEIEIIYDFKKEGKKEMTEEHKLKNISGSDAKKILELLDQKDIDIEDISFLLKEFIKKGKKVKKMSKEKTDDEERFSKEEVKVNTYMAEHKGVSYREAVLAVLDRTEPKPKKEFTAEEIKEQEQLKAVENYLDANPRATYSEACKVLFKGQETTLEEKLIQEYQKANPDIISPLFLPVPYNFFYPYNYFPLLKP